MSDWRSDVLKFWFGLSYDDWWKGTPELDHRIRERFLQLWSEKRQLPIESFLTDPLTAMAAVSCSTNFHVTCSAGMPTSSRPIIWR